MQKDQTLDLDEAKDKLKQAGISEDEMAALERQLAPAAENDLPAKEGSRTVVGFVRGGVEAQTDNGVKTTLNTEDIELPEEDDEEEEERVEVVEKDVPEGVYRGSVRMREDGEKDAPTKDFQGARERFKRQKLVGQ